MKMTEQISKHFLEVYNGGNWTWSNLRDQLKDVTIEQAKTQVYDLNTILILVNHLHYYVKEVTKYLEDGKLVSSDKESFLPPPINTQAEWESYQENLFKEAERFAELVRQLPDEKLESTFFSEKYGIYYRNLSGIIEHTHYHLGQIALIKKIVQHTE
jgi:hypothetical protein